MGARGVLLAAIALVAFPVRFHPIAPGLDQSWAFALNWLAANGYVHGRDVAFTYGPLGYLILPMDVGPNLLRGILFQAGFWLVFVGALAYAGLARRVPVWRLALAAVLVAGGQRAFHDFGYAGPDMFMGFTVLLLLGCALEGRWWRAFYAAAVATAVLLFFVKLSSGILALSAAGLFAVGLALRDRRRGLEAAAMAACAPALFAGLYLAYHPSFADLLRYVRAGMEISSGYSTAMSLESPLGAAPLAICAAYAGLAAALWWTRGGALPLALAGLGPLFLVFKHSFVRPHGHVEIFFRFTPLLVAAVLLFTAFPKRRWRALAAPLALFAAFWYPHAAWPREYMPAKALWNFAETRRALAAQSDAALAANRLPPELLARIGGATVTFLPWELAYAAANPLRYRPLPVLQSYSAYTAYLDGWNAEALEDPARAPEFVLFEWEAIDGRHPLLDTPATSLALLRHYGFDSMHGKRMLLRRRAAPRFERPVPRGTVRFRVGEPLRFEDRGHPLVARLRLAPSPEGAVWKFFYRVPEVLAIYSSDMGWNLSARVPPEVVSGGVPLNFVPANLEEARALFEDGRLPPAHVEFTLAGAGAPLYRQEVAAELWEFPDWTLARAPAPAAPAQGYEAPDTGKIETVNRRGVLQYGPNEVAEVEAHDGYVQVEGWAVDALGRAAASGVWMELDGRLYPATGGVYRPDIAAGYRNPAYMNGGFGWVVPAWKLGAGVHTLAMKVASADGGTRYDTPQRLRFRVIAPKRRGLM